ncbi:MAG: branched-chain amino acid ABC transporter permease, partial [Acidimicrobiia bacterium]|nr:branched-chain amino acid ABC transporter permease [Acidimicrobiia bacterium]
SRSLRGEARMNLRSALKPGVIGGIVITYLSFIGMVERFQDRNVITGLVGLGVVLMLVAYAITSYTTARKSDSPLPTGIAVGFIAGTFVALMTLGLEGLINAGLDVRSMFVSVTPGLLETLEFGLNPLVGAVVMVLTSTIVGAIAGGLVKLDNHLRSAIVYALGITLLMSLGEPILRVTLGNLKIPTGWLYELGGLTFSGTVVVVAAAFGLRWWWMNRADVRKEAAALIPDGTRRTRSRASLIAIIVVLIALPWIVGPFVSDVLGTVGLYVLLGLGLNIVVGYAGLLDLGYVAFFAVGAYAAAIFTSPASFLVTEEGQQFAEAGFTNLWIALPFVVIIAVIIGAAIGAPVLRLRGDYLAIVTLGFGEIIRTLVISDWLSPYLGGAQGLTRVPAAPPDSFDLRNPQHIYYLILAFGILAAYISYRLVDSRVGRAWAAMREDEDVAEAMGISVVRYKLLAFAMGAGVGSLGGVFFAAKIGSIFPNSFGLQVSINVLAVIILGGIGSIPGVIVGAAALVGLPELLREFGEFRLLIYGAILVAIMIFRPEGLIPNKRRQRELHEGQDPAPADLPEGAPS